MENKFKEKEWEVVISPYSKDILHHHREPGSDWSIVFQTSNITRTCIECYKSIPDYIQVMLDMEKITNECK